MLCIFGCTINDNNEYIDLKKLCVGLIKAIDNFDITLDLKLSSYGVPMVFLSRNLCYIAEKPRKQAVFSLYFDC